MFASVALAACASVFGFEDLTDRFDQSDSGSEPDALSTPPDSGPPPVCRPYEPSGPDVEGRSHHFALSTLGIVTTKVDPLGTNLDCKDTAVQPNGVDVDPNQSSCVLAKPSGNDAVQDGVGGLDNAGGAAFGAIPTFDPDDLPSAYARGLASIVFSLTRVALDASDDRSVNVFARPASNHNLDGTNECGPWESDGGPRTPQRSDEWCLDPARPEQLADVSWLAGGKLYAHFTQLPIPLVPREEPDEPLRLSYVELVDVWVTASVRAVDGGADHALVDGRIAGKWPTTAMFRQVGHLLACANKPIDENVIRVREYLCQHVRDVGTSADPSRACDATSVLFSFAGYEVETNGDQSPTNLPSDTECGEVVIPGCELPPPDFSAPIDAGADAADAGADADASLEDGGECDAHQDASCVQ